MRFRAPKYICKEEKHYRRVRRKKENRKNNIYKVFCCMFMCIFVCFHSVSRFYWFALIQLFRECHQVLFALLYCCFVCSCLFFIILFQCVVYEYMCVVSYTWCERVETTQMNKWSGESERFYAMGEVYSGWKKCAHVSIALAHWISSLMAYQWFNKD